MRYDTPEFLKAKNYLERKQRRAEKRARRKARKAEKELAAKARLPKQPRKYPPKRHVKTKNGFYQSEAWKRVRYEVLCEQGSTCKICGVTAADGARMNVDHIYPLSQRPDLALDKRNLRVLCASCNWGKGSRDIREFERAAWERFAKF